VNDANRKQENGVDMAIQSIYRDLDYARNLIKSKTGKNSARRESVTADGADADVDDDGEEEESWTFVGADADTVDDLSTDGVLKRTVADLKASASPIVTEARPLGNRVMSSSSGLGIETRR
jgi:sterol 3beta-glucosyltransferase